MIMDDSEFLQRLKSLADEYDEEEGRWPESEWEGFAVYDWISRKLTGKAAENDRPIYPSRPYKPLVTEPEGVTMTYEEYYGLDRRKVGT